MSDRGECSGAALVAGRRYRTPRLVAMLLAIVCVSACQSTTGSRLNVRAQPTTASPVIGNLGTAGTAITVECFAKGEIINGNATWYRISAPRTGYVTAYYVHMDDTSTTPPC